MNPIPLLIFKNHWMLYEEGIEYNDKKYNTYRLLEAQIKDGILKPMTMNEKLLIKSNCGVYLKAPIEIKLSEFDDKLFEFKQYTTVCSTSGHTRDIFYGDFECTTDGDYHKPCVCCTKKRSIDLIKTFQGENALNNTGTISSPISR